MGIGDNHVDREFTPGAGIDKVRASKAGHAYHEAWAARTALELLLPKTELVAITLEGFDYIDEADLGTGAVEIADLVRYYGHSDIARATRVEVVQFKYSIANAGTATRAADVASTLAKFALADVELRARHGSPHVDSVVRYDYATNRPIHPNLTAAVDATITGMQMFGDVAKQQAQISKVLADYPYPADTLLRRLVLTGGGGSLAEADRRVGQILASWSETSDPEAEVRLLKLRNLVRTKAGPDNGGDKRIDRVAVLAELKVDHEDQLYPTEDAFPPTGMTVPRKIVDDAALLARTPGLPLIVHGPGGMGKTVLMQGLAASLALRDQVVVFDGFGAGRWRDPADGRHRPERTLVHLANLLAGHGLCDILLPISDSTSLLRAFRQRLIQSVATVRQASNEAAVVLVLDAIDHAAIAAEESNTTSFAHSLLRSLSADPIEGLFIVASCRTERLTQALGGAEHRELEIPAFTPGEAQSLIHARDPSATPLEVAALEMRSGRNPRCLDTLLAAGRPYDLPTTPQEEAATPADVLDLLLRKRIDAARHDARVRGASDAEINLLLTGLALLPPPVPIDELAAAYGIALAQVESFAADLAPLLERTAHGLMFRDEPTETLIRKLSDDDLVGRTRIVETLFTRQSVSNYAARALPALLTALKDVDQLITLAFDERVPPGASKVSLRDIRLARITAALDLCAKTGRRDDLLRLLLEASIVAAGHERSDRFLYEFPDLAAAAGDAEALRRLFSTKAGWAGGRHSALALAYAFSGDFGEARRNARRAIDWYNWAHSGKQRNEFATGKASTQWDDTGFAYVEMLAGNDVRVTEFFARQGDAAGYQKFCDLFELLERHRASAHPPSDRIVRRLQVCQSGSRALWAAALRYSNCDPTHDRKIIERFAAASVHADRHDPLPVASLAASARAIALGRSDDAHKILATAAIGPPNLYDYTSYWVADRDADIAVVRGGLSAALRGKRVTLLDLAPRELLGLVAPSITSRGAIAFEKALSAKLSEPKPVSGVRPKRRRKTIDGNQRSEYHRALKERIRPLFVYAQAVADMVRPPTGQTHNAIFIDALDQLEQDVEKASNYPYNDGKSYLARVAFHALFSVADALGAIDPVAAERIVAWLRTAPGIHTPRLTAVINRLSRIAGCEDSALRLAGYVERKIQLDTDVNTRISSYGELARAVWRVSTEESAAYFRRTLDLTDAIGSDDFDRTNHLLELTGHYGGPALPAPAGHTFARILELNQNEDSKFPWIEYAQSMVPISGLATLAMIARLDDREKARLGLSLGPALTVLVRTGKLSGDLAACLIGLEAPIETWTWNISDFVSAALKTIRPARHEWFFVTTLVELDRDDRLSPARDTIAALMKLADASLQTDSPSRARIAALVERRGPEEAGTRTNRFADHYTKYTIDFADPAAIDRAILNQPIDQSGRRWPQSTIANIAGSLTTPADRLAFLKAVVGANTASLSDKISALDDFLPAWAELSAALRDALPEQALILASKHASDLIKSSSDGWGNWRGLIRDFNGDRPALIERVVASLAPTANEVSGDSWLALAAKLAPDTNSSAMATGLERFLAITDATLPTEEGDGPWQEQFSVEDDQVEAVAALIWARLGHQKAAMRWRAAHAVLRLAATERFDVIDALVARYDAPTVVPFGDAKLPAYPLHSRLWLLIALARLAADRPSHIAPHMPLFERVAFAENFPHVVMRSFALDALRALAPLLDPTRRASLETRIRGANVSPFAHQQADVMVEGRFARRPDSSPEPKDAFHLDYDFTKNQVERVCHVFNCGAWEVADRVTYWVRRWDQTVNGMYAGPRSGRDDDRDWASGYVPEADRYGGYLGWHGLMLAAGDMLQSRLVSGRDWGGDAWGAFLAEYRLSRRDGRWIAEATELFPLNLPRAADLPMPDVMPKRAEQEDQRLLMPLLGISGHILGSWLPISGYWSLPNDCTASLATALVGAADVSAVVMTLLTDTKFSRWLPHDEEEISRHFGPDSHSVREWISVVRHSERNLDRHDPYASTTAMQRSAPSAWVCDHLDLAADDTITRSWSDRAGVAFRSESWGTQGGRGEYSWDDSGQRLNIQRTRLKRLLGETELVLVGSLKLQRYHKDKPSTRVGDTSAFTHRSLVFSIDRNGRVETPLRAAPWARKAIAELAERDRHEFRDRFRKIQMALRDRSSR